MKKVLLISPTAVTGGAERCLASLVKYLPDLGWEPLVIVIGSGLFEEWLRASDSEFVTLKPGRVRDSRHYFATVKRCLKIAKSFHADIIVSNQTKGHLYGGTAARAAHLPSVLWQHGIPSGSMMDHLAKHIGATAIIVPSREVFVVQRKSTPRARVELIENGIEVDEIKTRIGTGGEIRRRLGLSGVPIVGIVGRLQPWKGQMLFLKAAEKVATRRPDVCFLVVGGAILGWEGSYPEDLWRYAEQSLALHGRVKFVGHQEDIYPWFDALDVVVHASKREPFGLVLLEAMAMGKPLVAVASGGPTEVIEDGRSGVLVRPDDDSSMATGILSLLNDNGFAVALSKGGQDRASKFSVEAMTRKWSLLLEEFTNYK